MESLFTRIGEEGNKKNKWDKELEVGVGEGERKSIRIRGGI